MIIFIFHVAHWLKRNTTVTCNAISARVATQVQNHTSWSIFPHKQIFTLIYFSTNKYVSPGPRTQNRLEWIPRMILPFFYPNILHHKNEYIPNTIVTCKTISGGGCNTFPELEIAKSEFLTHLRILREVIFRLFYHRFQIILHSNILEYGTLRIYDRPCFWHQKSEKSECFGNISKSTSTLTISWEFLL